MNKLVKGKTHGAIIFQLFFQGISMFHCKCCSVPFLDNKTIDIGSFKHLPYFQDSKYLKEDNGFRMVVKERKQPKLI